MLHFVAKIENHQIALRHFRFQDFFKKNLGREKQGPPVLTKGEPKDGKEHKGGELGSPEPTMLGVFYPHEFLWAP